MHRRDAALEKPNRALGLLAAVVLAWALLGPLPFLAILGNSLWWSPTPMKAASMIWSQVGMVFVAVIFMAIFGLPLSFTYCVGLGYPAWLLASHLGFKRRRNALAVGAILGLVLDFPLVMFAGVPTAYERHEPVTKLVVFYPGIALYVVGVGATAGLAAWWTAGGKSANGTEAMLRLFA